MQKTIIEKIKEAIERSNHIPSTVIEYNFELPKHKEIKKDSFFGVKARFEPNVKEGEIQLIYM